MTRSVEKSSRYNDSKNTTEYSHKLHYINLKFF
jgi:hypothetical protein